MSHDREAFFGADVLAEFDVVDPSSGPDKEEREFQEIVKRQIEEAQQWRRENLEPEQEKATDYYMTQEFGDEQEGRSKVVTSEVRDVVRAILPSLMRVFFGSERVVEFKPDGPEDVEVAKQQTEYINHSVTEDNPGFLALHAAFKDALVRKMGVVKWWWEDQTRVLGSEHTGLTADQVAFLQVQPGVEVEVEASDEELLEGRSETFNATVRRVENRGRPRIAAVPPEEFIFSPTARSKEDALMIGHVRDMRADELIAMGVPEDMVEDAKGGTRNRAERADGLAAARSLDGGAQDFTDDEQDDATLPVRFAEVYTRLDMDGDGIAELRKIQAVGDDAEFFTNEVVDSVPFAIFGPDPEPHTMVGLSVADYVMDIQRIKSAITRGVLDSLTLTLNPATEVVEGEVNMKDVLNPEVGRVIRTRKPGMMREIVTPFVGKEALPVLEYMDSLKEDRTGISKAAAGLDADALQSSTRAAVAATVSAAQQQIEMIARIFAETGMKDLFTGLLELVVQHQDRPRVVRLRNEFVEVDPRHWTADKDVSINVALGTGLVEEKQAMLGLIAEKQEQLLMAGAPLVGFSEYRATLARMVELAGFKNSNEFFRPFGPEEQQQFAQQQAQQAQEPTDTEALVQIETAKIQARAQEKAAELEFKRQKEAAEFSLKQAELNLKAGSESADADIEAARLELEKARAEIEALKTMSETKIGEDQRAEGDSE